MLVIDPTVSANSVNHAAEANSPIIPNYQWQFLSPSEKAAVDSSLQAIRDQRIKNVTLSIADENGRPYTGPIQVAQDSTSFIYFVGDPNFPEPDTPDSWSHFLALDPSRSIDLWAVWRVVEPQKGVYNFGPVDSNYNEYAAHGIVNFQAQIGPEYFPHGAAYSYANTLPDWAQSLDFQSLEGNMTNYVHALVSHFKGRIQFYHLWIEANAWFGNDNWPLDRIIDIIKMEALTIRATDPAAEVCVDLVYLTPDGLQFAMQHGSSNWTTDYFAQQLVAAGVPFDVLGLETHIGSGGGDVAGDVATLYNWLNELARFGKALYVWEDGLESYLPPDFMAKQGQQWCSFLWHGTPSEAKQTENMVGETLVYLGNPSVIGLDWFRLYDDSAFRNENSNDGVFYANGTAKMSFYAIERFWDSLMVNETVQSVNGVATFKGLAGNYSISAEGYGAEPSTVHVSEGQQNTFSLVLRSTTSITSITPTTSGPVYANTTAAAPKLIENTWLILAATFAIVIVFAAIIMRRRNLSGESAR